jgi:hypothetical protein
VTDFPYVKLTCCELCGRTVGTDQLRRVVLQESSKANGRFIAARAAWVCDRHREAEPIRPPQETTRVGTSKKRPQKEMLF